MEITDNLLRIKEGKNNIIASIQSKGVDIPTELLINEIPPYIEAIQGGGGDLPDEPGEIIPGGPHNPENDAFEEDFLWIENVDDTDGTITLNLEQAPFIYYSYDDDTEFQKIVTTNVLSIPAHSKIYLRWKGRIVTNIDNTYISFISNSTSNCNHNIGGELKNGGLKSNVYQYLFYNDKKLIDASQLKLSATTLASNCYSYMFSSCTALTQAPELLATTLAQYCYNYMFSSCTALTQAPELLATTLAQYCYNYMFSGCTALTIAPELPATTLASNCYSDMFSGCTALTTAPELPATTLAEYCYSGMFSGCTSLTYVKTNMINWQKKNSWDPEPGKNWLNNVSPSGIVEVLSDSNITENSTSGIPSGWTKQIDTSFKNTINIHNISGLENTISIPNKYSAFKYKTNNDTEYTENPKTTALTVTLQPDEILTIEGIYYPTTYSSSFTGITSTENINVSGEVNYSIPYMFVCLFSGNTKLIDASQLKLSDTTSASGCHYYMFSGCTALTIAPELPATTLASNCYSGMFFKCTSLTAAPELPATTLASNCYNQMFYGCKSLTTAPELPATELALYCYSQMFRGCTTLTTVPELPATTLASNCYNQMFFDCSKLNSLTVLSTEPFFYNDYQAKYEWLYVVSSTGTFRTPIANKEWIETYPRGYSAVPSGWTIEYIE